MGQDKKSIAVLPFKNMSNDPEQEYFSDGMIDEILDRLFKIGDLKVISRTSSMRYRNTDLSVKEIARELKALISPEEKRLIEKIPAADLEVYDKYLQARSYWNDFSPEAMYKALEFLNGAVEKNPGWAPLYAGLTQVWMGIQQMRIEPPEVAGPKIFENLNKALELDPDLAEAHYFNAMIAHLMEWDWEKSEKRVLKGPGH